MRPNRSASWSRRAAFLAVLATAPAARAADVTVTVLVTSDENGSLLPTSGPEKRGGAAETLGRWVAEEGHCSGPVKDGAPACANGTTLVLSTGDHFNGPALSSFFQGEPTAQAMARMGYAASGFGNHELDFSLEQFRKLREVGGFPYLAANVKVTDESVSTLGMKPFLVFERGGLKIGVIALSETQTRAKVMSGRGFGFEVLPYEAALTQAVTAVRKAGADALVVLADECPGVLEPMVRKHPEWKLAVLAGGHCHAPFDRKVGTTALVSPGRHWASYLRVKLSVDPSRPAGRRLAGVETRVVDVVAGPSAPPPDPALVQLLQPWIQKRDAVLGQRIGFTHSGLDAGSADLYAWVAGAMRGGTKSDVAIVNRKGIRAGLPAGPITAGEVYSVIPFENSVMGVKIKGAALVKALGNPAGVAAGVKKAGSGWVDGEGQKIDPDRVYAVALTDYLYFGGDGFDFEKADRQPVESGMVWQTMVIDQTKKLGSSEAQPLETLIR